MEKIALYIPAYNVENTILKVIERIPETIKEKATILVVDNASTDNTVGVLKSYIDENSIKNILLIRHQTNKGYGASQKTAYTFCVENDFRSVAMIHGDGQYAPELVGNLLTKLENDGLAMVFGSRISGNPLKGGMPVYRFIANKTLTAIQNLILGSSFSEFHSGFRVFNCKSLNTIPFQENSDDYHFDSEIMMQFLLKNMSIGEVVIPTHYGPESKSLPFLHCIQYGLNILWALIEFRLVKSRIMNNKKYLFH